MICDLLSQLQLYFCGSWGFKLDLLKVNPKVELLVFKIYKGVLWLKWGFCVFLDQARFFLIDHYFLIKVTFYFS